jgi:hypothetical protein
MLANYMKVYGGEKVYYLHTCIDAGVSLPVGDAKNTHISSDSAILSFVIA